MVFVHHVTFQDHVIKALYDFVEGPLKVSHHPAKFGGRRHCGKEDIMVLVYHITLQDHVMERPRGLMGSILRI